MYININGNQNTLDLKLNTKCGQLWPCGCESFIFLNENMNFRLNFKAKNDDHIGISYVVKCFVNTT